MATHPMANLQLLPLQTNTFSYTKLLPNVHQSLRNPKLPSCPWTKPRKTVHLPKIQAIETTTPTSSSPDSELGLEVESLVDAGDSNFDWYAQWYPVAIVDNLDKRVPTSVTIIGRDLVVWWDKNGGTWQVWEDKCPHRLAPLSEGRIHESGSLQCCYHGWCFAPNTGNCTLIPQAPADGLPVWKSEKACASVYPTVVQEGLIWFWPDSRPEFRNIATTKPPPSIPSLADPAFKDELSSRNLPYGYEQLIENLMDPAHVPFAHHGIQGSRDKATPLNYKVTEIDKYGYTGITEEGAATFIAPCIFYLDVNRKDLKKKDGLAEKKIVLLFICIPVSPGESKVIWSFRKNFSLVVDVFPRWLLHITNMLVLDSDMYMLHKTERKLAEYGDSNWFKACYTPTSSDAFVIAFRKWLITFAGGRTDWRGKYTDLPPTPPKEQLMDRYWSHVKQCRHCSAAMKFFRGLELFLQVLSVGVAALLGAAALKPIPQVKSLSIPLVILAVSAILAANWLSYFIDKTYRFHDYNHALVK